MKIYHFLILQKVPQEENGARTNLGGTGLGLSIVKKLVEKMHYLRGIPVIV